MQNSRLLRKALGPLDEEDIANFTKEELREMKYNLNQPIEPSPLSENGSGSGDTESGMACITSSTVNVLLSTKCTVIITYSKLQD